MATSYSPVVSPATREVSSGTGFQTSRSMPTGRLAPVLRVAIHHQPVVLDPFDELEWAGADRLLTKTVRSDARPIHRRRDVNLRQHQFEWRIRILGVDDDGHVVDFLDAIDRRREQRIGRRDLGVHENLDAVDDGVRVERLAVGEADPLAHGDLHRGRAGQLPGFRKEGLVLAGRRIVPDQRLDDRAARVEIVGGGCAVRPERLRIKPLRDRQGLRRLRRSNVAAIAVNAAATASLASRRMMTPRPIPRLKEKVLCARVKFSSAYTCD